MLAYIGPGTNCLIVLPLLPRVLSLAATLVVNTPVLLVLGWRWPQALRAAAVVVGVTGVLDYGLLLALFMGAGFWPTGLFRALLSPSAFGPDLCMLAAALGPWLLVRLLHRAGDLCSSPP